MSEVVESHAGRVQRQRQVLEQLEPWQLELLGVLVIVNWPLTDEQWLMHASQRGVRGPGAGGLRRSDVLAVVELLNQRGLPLLKPHMRTAYELGVTPEVVLGVFELLHARSFATSSCDARSRRCSTSCRRAPRSPCSWIPYPKEQAYYEALRQPAVEKLAAGDPRKKRFRVLAEITRLRQAYVDPRLLDEHAAPAGAKLDAALEHVLALREEGLSGLEGSDVLDLDELMGLLG